MSGTFSDIAVPGVLPPVALRQPRLLVLANGSPLVGAIDAEVINSSHYAADRFCVTLSIGVDPGAFATLSALTTIRVEVQVSLDGGASFASLILGNADCLEIDPLRGTWRMSGRDLSAGLIEARTQETFANQTSSEIATTLAGRHGLQADVQTTTTVVGRYWQLEHDRIVLNRFASVTTEWDLLVLLAGLEGFDAWVTGTTLHFRAPVATPAPEAVLRAAATPDGPANVTGLRLERALNLAQDIQVTVKSWNSRQQRAFVRQATRAGAGGNMQDYVYVVPNLAPDDALHYAQNRLAELIQHERCVGAEMPGELSLAPRTMLRLEGTGTDFDQAYWIGRVERRISMRHGFTQMVHAKNTNLASQQAASAEGVMSPWTVS
jgi:hypothetical protein